MSKKGQTPVGAEDPTYEMACVRRYITGVEPISQFIENSRKMFLLQVTTKCLCSLVALIILSCQLKSTICSITKSANYAKQNIMGLYLVFELLLVLSVSKRR